MASTQPIVDPDTGTTRRRVQFETQGKSMTEQSHKAQVDINNIMARYVKSGVLDHIKTHEAQYADVTPVEYHEAMNRVTAAKTMFEELPAPLRLHFDNNPAKFLEYCNSNPNASDDLVVLADDYHRRATGQKTRQEIKDEEMAKAAAAAAVPAAEPEGTGETETTNQT